MILRGRQLTVDSMSFIVHDGRIPGRVSLPADIEAFIKLCQLNDIRQRTFLAISLESYTARPHPYHFVSVRDPAQPKAANRAN